MKKVRFVVLLVLIIALLFSACANAADTTSEPTTTPPEPQSRRELSWSEDPWDDFDVVLDKIGTPQGSESELEIPVYYENELLFKTDGLFFLNRDACFYEGQNMRQNYTGALLEAYPTSAIRSRDRDNIYFVYMTDTGYRLYLFASSDNDFQTPVGFPVVIGKLLSYDDFKDIKVGDGIEKVEAVDSVANLHKKLIVDLWDLEPVAARKFAEEGYPCTTIHYLKDGILKIEYEMQADQNLVVSNVVFNKEFQIESANGKVVNYKIADIDLPA